MNNGPAEPGDATPLTAEEREGLIPSHVTLRRELNELEQQNILSANVWGLARRRDPVNETFGRNLHRRMFGGVWRWAGTYRTSNKNIGVDCGQIHVRLHAALDNVRYWIEHKTFPPDEIAVRFHHALVLIHPFPNGNGRWSRLMVDILAVRLGQSRFTWGSSTWGSSTWGSSTWGSSTWGSNALRAADETRRAYIDALRAADSHDFARLIAFARS